MKKLLKTIALSVAISVITIETVLAVELPRIPADGGHIESNTIQNEEENNSSSKDESNPSKSKEQIDVPEEIYLPVESIDPEVQIEVPIGSESATETVTNESEQSQPTATEMEVNTSIASDIETSEPAANDSVESQDESIEIESEKTSEEATAVDKSERESNKDAKMAAFKDSDNKKNIPLAIGFVVIVAAILIAVAKKIDK